MTRRTAPSAPARHAVYQVTLDGLGTAAATQRWTVSTRVTFGSESAAAARVLRQLPDAATPSTMTLSFEMHPDDLFCAAALRR